MYNSCLCIFVNYIRIPTSAFRCEKCHDITAFVNGRMFYKKNMFET